MIYQTLALLFLTGVVFFFLIKFMLDAEDLSEDDKPAARSQKQPVVQTSSEKKSATGKQNASAAGAEDGESTPKAEATKPPVAVPSFNLDMTEEPGAVISNGTTTGISTASQISASQVHQRNMPPKSPIQASNASSLMPPPSIRPPAKLKSPPGLSNGLRVPTTGPLPNRGPPASQKTGSGPGLAPVANTAGKRNKVLLKPGHSPLDWAHLTESGNLSGVATMQRVTPSTLKFNHGRKGRPAWSSHKGKVYNITPYLPFHPGGEGELMRAAGKDGEKLFMEIHPWVNWDNMLNSCLVGIMVSEGDGEGLDGVD